MDPKKDVGTIAMERLEILKKNMVQKTKKVIIDGDSRDMALFGLCVGLLASKFVSAFIVYIAIIGFIYVYAKK